MREMTSSARFMAEEIWWDSASEIYGVISEVKIWCGRGELTTFSSACAIITLRKSLALRSWGGREQSEHVHSKPQRVSSSARSADGRPRRRSVVD